jgi:hypothetical protein
LVNDELEVAKDTALEVVNNFINKPWKKLVYSSAPSIPFM